MTVETDPEVRARESVLHELQHSTLVVVETDATSVLIKIDDREVMVTVYASDVTGWRDET